MVNINVLYQIQRELPASLSPDGRRHSQLAMQAAKRMAATRQKARHGRVVCHHLLRMLSSEPGGRLLSHQHSQHSQQSQQSQPGAADFELTSPAAHPAQDRQYESLAGRAQGAQAEQFSLGF
jgi:hypothetical protein